MHVVEIWHLILEPESDRYILLSGDLMYAGSSLEDEQERVHHAMAELLFHERREFGQLVASMLGEKYEV